MTAPRQDELMALFTRVTIAAQNDPDYADQVRELLAESGLLDVFGAGATLDVVDLLDSGGEDVLRVRLHQLTLAELRQVVASHKFDEEKESARWRSQTKFVELIIRKAKEQLEAEIARQNGATSGASWML
jgi:hypothetical protein